MSGNRTVSAGVEADWSREVTRTLVIPDVNRCDSLIIIIIIIKGIYIAQVRKGLTTKTKKIGGREAFLPGGDNPLLPSSLP